MSRRGLAVLVVNAGSSSLKYQLIDPASGDQLATGQVERIGDPGARDNVKHAVGGGEARRWGQACADLPAAFGVLVDAFAAHGPDLEAVGLAAVGHRVVHGGRDFTAPTVIDDDVVAAVTALVPLAPLHNPAGLAGIRCARERFPDLPQVAVFDTAFHQTIPARAHTYAVPRSWREQHGVRRYGFHGTSYTYVSRRTAELLGRPIGELAMVILHLGNGASAAAVKDGVCVDTSMGFSPLEGLVMGTRSGDVDASVTAHMVRAGLSSAEVDTALNKSSGLLGLSGHSDFREVVLAADTGDEEARLAIEVTAYRIRKYVGAYAAALGRLDAVVFTAGVGEHNPRLRASVLGGLELLGIRLDEEVNASGSGERTISSADSPVAVLVVPTDEEREIARQTAEVLGL